jgi:DNA polymerase-3 subunit alpha
LGEAVAQAIINERKNGPYTSIFNFAERLDPTLVNKRSYEALAYAGGFDDFTDIKRHQYFCENGTTFIELLLKYSQQIRNDKLQHQQTLFGEALPVSITKPEIPQCEEWSNIFKLKKELEYIGIYMSSHPLEPYVFDIETNCNTTLFDLSNKESLQGKEIKFAGMVSHVLQRTTKTGKPFITATLEDYTDIYSLSLFGQDYVNYANFFKEGLAIIIKAKVPEKKEDDGKNNFQPDIIIQKIMLLSEIRNLYKTITLQIDLNELSPTFINELTKNIKQAGKGKTDLVLRFYTSNELDKELRFDMVSKKHKIFLSNDFLRFLKEYDISFSVS